MFFQRRKLEEDLTRIRKANLSPEKLREEEDAEQKAEGAFQEARSHLGAKDVFAMVIAVFSLILPYVLGLLAVWALVVWLFIK